MSAARPTPGAPPSTQPSSQPATQPASTGQPAGLDPLGTGDWAAFHGGGHLVGQAAPVAGPPMKVRWTYRTGKGGVNESVAIVGPTVYAADDAGVLHAISLADGKARWTFQADRAFNAAPLVAGGQVFIGDSGGVFHAVAAATGRENWTFEADDPIHGSANLAPEGVIFATEGGQVIRLDPACGRTVWISAKGERINGAAAIGDGAAWVAGCDAKLRAINLPDGAERLKADLGQLTGAAPILVGDAVIVGTDQGRVVCLAGKDGKQRWLYDKVADEAMVYATAACADGVVVVGARDSQVHAIDAAGGESLWTFATRGDVDSSPAISAGRVYVGSRDGKLYVLDLKQGKLLWEFDAGRPITAGPAVARGVVVIADTGGNVYCLEPEKE